MSDVEPFLLYFSKRFLKKASESFKLDFIVRRPLAEILNRIDIDFRELERDEANSALEGIAEAKGLKVSIGQLVKSLALALFLPRGLFDVALRKLLYRAGVETDGFIILEFLAEIPRMMRPSQFYALWLILPKTPEGAKEAKRLIKAIVEMVEAPPLTQEEWREAEPIREKLIGRLKVKGLMENLWSSL